MIASVATLSSPREDGVVYTIPWMVGFVLDLAKYLPEKPLAADGVAGTVSLVLDSAWSPPAPFYRTMLDLGYDVRAYYFEPGMAFCGRFTNEGDDEYQEMPDTPALCVELIPADIREVFNLPEDYYDES